MDADRRRRRRRGRRSTRSTPGSWPAPAPRAAAIRRAVAMAVPDGASGLSVVMELDDLGVGQVPDRLFGEPLHQHGADREVGSDEHADVALLRPHRVGIEPRGADDDVDPVLDAPGDVRGSDGRAR